MNEYVYIRFSFKDLKNVNNNQEINYQVDHVIKYVINFGENNYNESLKMQLLNSKAT